MPVPINYLVQYTYRLITNKDLVDMGYRPSTANHIIHLARDLLVARGFSFYSRKRMMVVLKK